VGQQVEHPQSPKHHYTVYAGSRHLIFFLQGQHGFESQEECQWEIEKFIIRQPPIGEKDDYDSENSWISDGLPSSSRRRRRGGGRWEVGEWREK